MCCCGLSAMKEEGGGGGFGVVWCHWCKHRGWRRVCAHAARVGVRVFVCDGGTHSQASLVCEVRREKKSGVPRHASTSSCSICPVGSLLHKLETLCICFGVHCLAVCIWWFLCFWNTLYIYSLWQKTLQKTPKSHLFPVSSLHRGTQVKKWRSD